MTASVKIDIPMDLYEELKRRAKPFEDRAPADVIRRLLDAEPKPVPPVETSGTGYLMMLVDADLISPGDTLVLERRRVGDRYTARVTDTGRVELPDGREFSSPSGAAKACVGSSQNGWARWRHIESGKTLDELRSQSKPSYGS